MLPSKGYFSPLPCPYHDSGECLRPHCHYRHTKKDKSANLLLSNSNQRTQKDTDVSNIQDFVTLTDNSEERTLPGQDNFTESSFENSKNEVPSYKPTPIAELNKRHIPVAYAPTRPSSLIRKKEVKESLLYLPRSISKCASSANNNAYVPSSSGSSGISNSYTYQPSKITTSAYSINDCKSLLKDNAFVNEEEKLFVLDKLIDEEFGANHESVIFNNNKIHQVDELIQSKKQVDDNDFNEHVDALNSKKQVDILNSKKQVDILNSEKQADVLHSRREVDVLNPIKQVDILNSEKQADVLNSKKEVDSLNSKNQVERITVEPVRIEKSHCVDNIISKPLIKKPLGSTIICSESTKTDAKTETLSDKNNCSLETRIDSCNANNENIDISNDEFTSKNKNESINMVPMESKSSLIVKPNTHKKSENVKNKSSSSSSHKSREKRDSEKTDIISDDKTKHSSSYKEHSKSKHVSSATDSTSSKSKSSSHKSNDGSKSKSISKEKLEHSKSKHSSTKHVEQSKSKHGSSHKNKDNLKSKDSSGKNEIHSKPKRSSSCKNEDSLKKDNYKKNESHNEHNKDQNHDRRSSDHESKNENHSRSSSHKKCRKKEKDDDVKKKVSKDRDPSSPPPEKIMKIELSSDEYDDNESDECASSNSDVQEVVNDGETIIIESSSNSSDSNCFDKNVNWAGVHSASDSPPTSPPPPKKMKFNNEDKSVSSMTSLQSILCDRWRKARETVSMKSSVPGKIKISQVPNVKNILNAKDELFAKASKRPQKFSASSLNVKKKIVLCEEYVPRPATRIAHAPKEALAQYPVIKMDVNLKVPVATRQSCLNNIFDEYKKYLLQSKAVEQAVKKEFEICQRSKVTKTYQNACALAVLRIRKTEGHDDEDVGEKNKLPLKSDSITEYTYGWTLYKCFEKYLLTDEQLIENGFPIPLESYKGCAYIDKGARRYQNKQPSEQNSRICSNCSKQYYVDKKGIPSSKNDCFYHWGKTRKVKVGGGLTEIYICCGADAGSEPCSTGKYHISSSYDEDCLEGFVKTLPQKPNQTIDSAGIYALDCEMIYTTQGLDLARCTLVNIDGELVYDKFVIPDYPILDYCTRFSGVTEIDMKEAKLKLKDVQQELLDFINEKTIIVGHSLENDLKVLRIFHKSIVDTSVVFPHARGLPYKRALRHVAKDILNINIQDQETGHDSKEDALTCMQIMLWKVKEDAKGRKPRVIISLGSRVH